MKYCSIVDLTKELKPRADVRYKARVAERQGIMISEVSFQEFKDFYTSIVSVKKSEEVWDELSKIHFAAFIAKKDDMPITAAAFVDRYFDRDNIVKGTSDLHYPNDPVGREAYYNMAVSDYSSPYSKRAAYLLQIEVMKSLKEKGYERYVVGVLAEEGDSQKLKNISNFKKQFGEIYLADGDMFPFRSYTPLDKHHRESSASNL